VTGLGPQSRLAVAHLVVRREDEDEYVVGDPANGTFVTVPEVGARLIDLLAMGCTVEEAEAELERETGEAVDVLDFAEVLVEAGVIDGRDADEAEAPKGKSWMVSRIPARFVRPLFGRTAWTVYVGCLATSLFIFVVEPGLLPTYEDTFVFTDLVASLLLTNLYTAVVTIIHEVWHAFAGAAVGIQSTIRLERRGIFPVLETNLTGLWALPPQRRYGPFLAGMAFDSVVLFTAVGLRFAYSRSWVDLPDAMFRILAMVVFVQVVKLAFQTLAYLRTDMYLVMTTATGCRNLHQVTRLSLKRIIRKLKPDEAVVLRDAHERDLKVARWYRLLYLAGLVWMAWFALRFLLPSTIVVLGWAGGVLAGSPIGTKHWWEAVFLVSFALLNLALPIGVVIRNRIQARRAQA
jgi:hypothetical protein